MKKGLKNKIIEDWIVAYKRIDKVVSREKENWWVVKPQQYLSPSIRGYSLSLDDELGEFFHYNKICESLEKVLAGEKAEYFGRFRDAPEEIKQLLDRTKLE